MKAKRIKLVSGDLQEEVSIPSKNLVGVLTPKAVQPKGEPEKLIREALENPVDMKPLENILDRDSKVTIVVDDATRQTPTRQIIKHVLERLEKIGTKRKNILIQIANGMHRLTTEDEKKKILGEDVLNLFEVQDNYPEDRDCYEYLGKTSRGTPLYINRRVTNADLVVTIGMIKSHAFAGFTGGAKSIIPGVSSKETILSNHCFKFVEYPNGILGDAERSVTRRDMEEGARKLPVFIMNVVLNKENRIIDVVSGDVVSAHRRGVKTFKEMAEVYLDEPIDLVIVEGGYPGSINLYQALFGCNVALTTRRPILKRNGTILFLAQCREGVGSDMIERLFDEFKDPGGVLNYLKNSKTIPEQWAAQFLASFLLISKIGIVTEGIPKRKLEKLGLIPFNTIQEAIDSFLSENEDLKIAIIKDPDFVIPNLR